MTVSLFEIFKIGIGPSSSHTVGPMVAARRYLGDLEAASQIDVGSRSALDLYGSLALTGRGHGTHGALILGLCRETPEPVQPITAEHLLSTIQKTGTLSLLG